MDVCESEQTLPKHKAVETPRPPLVPAEKNNAVTTRRSRTREVSSRYKSPTLGTPSGTRRFPSPNPRAMPASSQLLPKRPHSAERRRPSTSPSPRTPSTPVHESSVDVQLSSRRIASRLPEHLWPSTKRSLGVSFQSDTISIPASMKEKPIPSASDRTLRPPSNVAHRPAETLTIRKPSPERMRSPLKGKNTSDQSENSKPVDSLHSRLIDQHRWPSRIGGIGKTSSNALNRSVDLADKTVRTLTTPVPGTALSSLKRLSQPEEVSNTLQKATSDSARLLSCVENGSVETEVKSASDNILLAASAVRSQSLPSPGSPLPSPIKTSVQSSSSARSDNILIAASAFRSQSLPGPGSPPPSPIKTSVQSSSIGRSDNILLAASAVRSQSLSSPGSPLPSAIKTSVLSSSSERSDNILLAASAVRSQSLPSPRSRLPSPIKTSVLSSSSARGVSPSRSRPSTPPSRVVSPSPIGQTDISSQANSLKPLSPGSPLPSPFKTSVLSSSSERSDNILLAASAVRSQSLPSPRSRLPSPIKTSLLSSSSARGVSPSRSRPSTPPSRGVSPSPIGQTDTSSQANSLISVFNIITDYKKAKKGAADAHHLRLLHNRYLQWRFANARAEALLYIQKATVEKTLYKVWNTLLSLRDSVIRKRINLQQLKLELKLNSVLNDQMAYLDDWALLEIDHVGVLSRAVGDLEASTIRLPIAGGAKADIEQLKIAICSAVDAMQAMGSAICSLLTRAEGMNSLISELALVVAQEKTMVDECEVLLASAAAMQVEENSLRAHLLQVKQSLRNLSTLEADPLLS
ncbi:hypothetical protein L6164_011553 [Bauhinia variegata]|uniref:Uncharacterized protein n=1 Tax=Bauhinia variegata TaxID=167791 RepID=A0ACB9P6A2_BAUVA|nr:hypothetical protein L6164_011553 [Bauhinia variegata]